MPAQTATNTALAAGDIKFIVWFAGAFISALSAGAGVAWWFSRQQSQTRKELYTKINGVKRDVDKEIKTNKESCSETKERVGLLEQSHGHLEQRIDGIDNKLEAMQQDITSTKEGLNMLSQKQSENHLTVVGEIRGLGDKLLIDQLTKSRK